MTGKYSIRDLEKLSGIKAHTIRIWELRYGLLTPSRTDTNIRHYSNDDLRKLLNVSSLIEKGMKISNISKLTSKQIQEEIAIDQNKESAIEDYLPSAQHALMIALYEYDEESFNKAFSLAVLKFGFADALFKVLYPVLNKIGLLWSSGEIVPAQEHFISNLVKQKLFSATDSLLLNSDKKETFILFLPENEMHEIGLLLTNYLLRSMGKHTIYLGQSVPLENVIATYKTTKAKNLVLFIITPGHHKEISAYLQKLSTGCKNAHIYLSGNGKMLDKIKLTSNVVRLKSPEDLKMI